MFSTSQMKFVFLATKMFLFPQMKCFALLFPTIESYSLQLYIIQYTVHYDSFKIELTSFN